MGLIARVWYNMFDVGLCKVYPTDSTSFILFIICILHLHNARLQSFGEGLFRRRYEAHLWIYALQVVFLDDIARLSSFVIESVIGNIT